MKLVLLPSCGGEARCTLTTTGARAPSTSRMPTQFLSLVSVRDSPSRLASVLLLFGRRNSLYA